MSFVLDFATKVGAKKGTELMTSWGGIGLGVGAGYGIISDQETLVSGATKGLTLGVGGAWAAKYGSARMIDGMNRVAAESMGQARAFQSTAADSSVDYLARQKAMIEHTGNFNKGDAMFFSAGKASKGFFNSTQTLSGDVTEMRAMHKNFADALKSKSENKAWVATREALFDGSSYDERKHGEVFKFQNGSYTGKNMFGKVADGPLKDGDNIVEDVGKQFTYSSTVANNLLKEYREGLSLKGLGLVKD